MSSDEFRTRVSEIFTKVESLIYTVDHLTFTMDDRYVLLTNNTDKNFISLISPMFQRDLQRFRKDVQDSISEIHTLSFSSSEIFEDCQKILMDVAEISKITPLSIKEEREGWIHKLGQIKNQLRGLKDKLEKSLQEATIGGESAGQNIVHVSTNGFKFYLNNMQIRKKYRFQFDNSLYAGMKNEDDELVLLELG